MTFYVKSITNIPGFDVDLISHDHEEADTLLILDPIDTDKSNPFSECIAYSSNTVVFDSTLIYTTAASF